MSRSISSEESSNYEGGDERSNEDDDSSRDDDSSEVKENVSDRDLFYAVLRNDVTAVQRALRNGANELKCNRDGRHATPLTEACCLGYDEIVRMLLDAGAEDSLVRSAMQFAVIRGHLSIVEMLLHHDQNLLEIAIDDGRTLLMDAIRNEHFEVAHFLLDRGANALATNVDSWTTLTMACRARADLRLVQRLLAAGVDVNARTGILRTALHYAVFYCDIEVVRELIVLHNANMFAVDKNGETPFDAAQSIEYSRGEHALLIDCYGNKLTVEHDRLALHAVLGAAKYSFLEDYTFHPPKNPLRIHLPLGKLTWQQFRTLLLSTLDANALIHNRDESGTLPIHMACRNKAPVEVLTLLVEIDPATLHMADYCTGALPIHECCCDAVDDSSVRFLVEQGGTERCHCMRCVDP